MPDLRDPTWDSSRVYLLTDGTLTTEDGRHATAPSVTQPQTFDFAEPATSWTCVHNLGRHPLAVAVYGTDGKLRVAPVVNPDPNTTVIMFGSPQSGSVVLA